MCECVRVCACACVRACVRACVCVTERERTSEEMLKQCWKLIHS